MSDLYSCCHICLPCKAEKAADLERVGFRLEGADDPLLDGASLWSHAQPNDRKCEQPTESPCFEHRQVLA